MRNEQLCRRKVLKSFGAAATIGGSGMFSTARVSARNKSVDRDIIRQSLRILEETNSQQKRIKFLRNHGVKVRTVHNTYSIPIGHESDDIGVRKVPKRDLEIHMSMYISGPNYNQYSSELTFQYEMDRGDWGAHPWDIAAMSWDPNWWMFANGSVQEDIYAWGPNTIGYRDDPDISGSGVAFNVGDNGLPEQQTSDWFVCGVNLAPAGGDQQDRRVYGQFTHTWSGTSIEGISLGWKSISVNLENNTYKWSTDHERNGKWLIVHE